MLDDLVSDSPNVSTVARVDSVTPKLRQNYSYTKEQKSTVIEMYKRNADLLMEDFAELAREKIQAPKLGIYTLKKWITDYEASERRSAGKRIFKLSLQGVENIRTVNVNSW